jgi:hypothetical protein
MPSVSLESNPGDAIFFNQSIWHAIFNGWAGRRYIALKFAARPQTDNHIASLRYYAGNIFDPHPNWLASQDARVQSMVGELPALARRRSTSSWNSETTVQTGRTDLVPARPSHARART